MVREAVKSITNVAAELRKRNIISMLSINKGQTKAKGVDST